MISYWRPIVTALIILSSHLATTLPAAGAWDHVHGDSANTGFARVSTRAAISPFKIVPLGRLALGAGPVIGPSGTVYVANIEGGMLAFRPDGSPAWQKSLPGRGLASPVVDSGGSVYVTGVHRGHHPSGGVRNVSTLQKLSGDTGDVVWSVPLPWPGADPASSPPGGPVAAAPPSIWRSGSIEVVVMPVTYMYPRAVELRLLAFAPQNGALLGNTVVSSKQFDVTGSGPDVSDREWACLLALAFDKPAVIPLCITYNSPFQGGQCGLCIGDKSYPMPGVAIAPDPHGGPPSVIVSDELNQDTVGYRFAPGAGFTESWRVPDRGRRRTSTPTALPDGHIVMGTQDGDSDRGRVTFVGPRGVPPLADVNVNIFRVLAAPTRLGNGLIAAIQLPGTMTVLRANRITKFLNLRGESIAAAAASCTHLFVASVDAFTTYDAATLKQVAQWPWAALVPGFTWGGLTSPAIGPTGWVYGVERTVDPNSFVQTDSLVVFEPPPPSSVINPIDPCAHVVVHPL
jgi:outer membrane protein assembly factor BamB